VKSFLARGFGGAQGENWKGVMLVGDGRLEVDLISRSPKRPPIIARLAAVTLFFASIVSTSILAARNLVQISTVE
jgi:hypothetical protein